MAIHELVNNRSQMTVTAFTDEPARLMRSAAKVETMIRGTPLSNLRILVLQDEYLLADGFHQELEAAGVVAIGPAPTVKSALALVEIEGPIDAALLDVNLYGDMVFPVADALVVRSVPFVFTSGCDDDVLAEHFALGVQSRGVVTHYADRQRGTS